MSKAILRVEYLPHQSPFLSRGGIWVAALELAYVGFPFGLAGKGGEPCHVTVPVEVVHGVHYHEQDAALGVNLHREYAYGVLSGYDFGPDVRMYLYVFLDQFGVVFQCQGLTIAFHTVELFQTLAVPLEEPLDPVLDLNLVGPTEGVELAYVDELAHCAVRLGGVELDGAGEAYGLDYQLGKFPDGEFLAGAYVDVAVADFAEGRDGAAAAGAVVAIYHTVGLIAVMDGRVFLDADDVLEIHVQEDVHRGVGHILAPEEFPQWSTGSPEDDTVVGDSVECEHFKDGGLVRISVNDIADGLSILLDVRSYRPDAQILANCSPIAVIDEFGKIDLAHHRRHHVGVLQVEIVVRTVEVGRHHGNVVRAVLEIVALAHLQACDLCDGVFLIGVFQWRCEEAVLFHRLGCVLRIDAGGTQEEEFLHAVGVGLADDIALHLHVLHDEVCAIQGIGHDTADEGGCKYHCVRTFLIKETPHRQLVGEVKFAVGAAYEVHVAAGLEIVPDGGAYQAPMAGYVDF